MNTCDLSITLTGTESKNYIAYRDNLQKKGYKCLTALINRVDYAEKLAKSEYESRLDLHTQYKEVRKEVNNLETIAELSIQLECVYSMGSKGSMYHQVKYEALSIKDRYNFNLKALSKLINQINIGELSGGSVNKTKILQERWVHFHPAFSGENANENFKSEVNKAATIEIAKYKRLSKLERKLDKQHLVNRLRKQNKFLAFFTNLLN